jgi:hypothetical protein
VALRDNAQAAVRRGRRGDRQRVEDVVVDDRDQPGRRVRVRRLAGGHSYHGVLRGTDSVLEGHSMDCGRAGTDGEGRPEPDARGPQADRRAPAHTCARTGAGLGSPLSSVRCRLPNFDSSTRGGARGVHAQVLMSPSIRMLEPLWTLIPASKAILPVLWAVAARASPPPAHIGAGTGLTPVWAHGFYGCCDSCCCSRPCNRRRCAMRPLPLQCNNKQHQQPRQPLAYP